MADATVEPSMAVTSHDSRRVINRCGVEIVRFQNGGYGNGPQSLLHQFDVVLLFTGEIYGIIDQESAKCFLIIKST